MNKGSNHGGIVHHLHIPIDSIHAVGTSIRFVAGINLYHVTILGSAGDLHFHQSLGHAMQMIGHPCTSIAGHLLKVLYLWQIEVRFGDQDNVFEKAGYKLAHIVGYEIAVAKEEKQHTFSSNCIYACCFIKLDCSKF
ncbi:hypothetical protein AAHA92_24230 [Salvia divinorum]|uniref:Uncharacterized protein n=1 Tax=Salvia divinorum TaxID=28513 RepID=A0ABD1G6R1_SALDI